MDNEIRLRVDDAIDLIKAKYDRIITKRGVISNFRNYSREEVKEILQERFDYSTILDAINVIPAVFEKRKTIREHSSYWLKHRLEGQLKRGYISNGEFIVAMLLCGYPIIIDKDKHDYNAYFRVKVAKSCL